MTWTQPVCNQCWSERASYEPQRRAVPEPERCCYCGGETESGIYLRIDPATVPYPSEDD